MTIMAGSAYTVFNQIKARILMSGPIPVAEYMRLALTQMPNVIPKDQAFASKDAGYYMTKDVFGAQGDFITSPEISQMFGEMLSVWGMQTVGQIGGPKKFNIVELGPGRGSLAKDMLRVFRQFRPVAGFNISLHLVEISPYLAKLQYETLCCMTTDTTTTKDDGLCSETDYQRGISQEYQVPVFWYRHIKDVPRDFTFFVAHEFFDALPIHKLQKINDAWREVLVDVRPESQDQLRFIVSRNETPVIKVLKSHYPELLRDSRNHLEVSLDTLQILGEIATRLEENGGVAIIVDYGHLGTKEDTFRAFSKHKLHDPLIEPGTADLTADVDFSLLTKAFSANSLMCGPVTQNEFLSRVGINLRLQQLLDNCKTENDKNVLMSGHKMLMEDMGSRFLFMSMMPKVLEPYLDKLKIAGFH